MVPEGVDQRSDHSVMSLIFMGASVNQILVWRFFEPFVGSFDLTLYLTNQVRVFGCFALFTQFFNFFL